MPDKLKLAKDVTVVKMTVPRPKGHCPVCGTVLVKEAIVWSWGQFGFPQDTTTELFCRECNKAVIMEPIDPHTLLKNWSIDDAREKFSKAIDRIQAPRTRYGEPTK